MCWLKVTAFWGSGVTIKTFFAGAALEAILWWVSWIDITGGHLVAFGTGKGKRLGVNSSGVRSDDEGFAGHGREAGFLLTIFITGFLLNPRLDVSAPWYIAAR
jgi:hypothetical protein